MTTKLRWGYQIPKYWYHCSTLVDLALVIKHNFMNIYFKWTGTILLQRSLSRHLHERLSLRMTTGRLIYFSQKHGLLRDDLCVSGRWGSCILCHVTSVHHICTSRRFQSLRLEKTVLCEWLSSYSTFWYLDERFLMWVCCWLKSVVDPLHSNFNYKFMIWNSKQASLT